MASKASLYVPAYMRCMFADMFTCFAGELPKELGDLVNLTKLYLSSNKFEGGIPAEWADLPNLKNSMS